ncbi:hypothetical protein GUJ93_ZPchr0010g9792 [Zizania palustris]|uniref:Uncharacterized protein n=1 Tax=Zizania palustris TaxID=103762 RepID=A0A8J5WED8_ZIZPA|nr:hypothetical protein GUJ93_ZPchr0010g9792 [Zizania palustris]
MSSSSRPLFPARSLRLCDIRESMASGGPRRKPRRKVKKRTRYLSLSRHVIKAADLEAARSPEAMALEDAVPTPSSAEEDGDGCGQHQHQQPEPFALHPEPSTLFAAAPSLTDILGASAGDVESSSASPEISGGTELPDEEDDLARRALRGRERWVYCSSSPSATTSSSCSSAASTGASSGAVPRSLLLKLDYEEIVATWAGRGSLYIGGGAAELELDSVFVEVGPSEPAAAGAWSAPETAARVETGEGETVQGEAAGPAVREAHSIRGSPAQCRQAAAPEGPFHKEGKRPDH